MRQLIVIVEEIQADWKTPSEGATRSLAAMPHAEWLDVCCECNMVKYIVGNFLENSDEWVGDVADRIKKELSEALS